MSGHQQHPLTSTVQSAKVTNNPSNIWQDLVLDSERGQVAGRFYQAQEPGAAILWLSGVDGGFDTPDDDLYPALGEQFAKEGISSLWIRYRFPTILPEAVFDALCGIHFFETRGVQKIGLVGHSLGGAVVIQAATKKPSVKTVITLACQTMGAEQISELGPNCSILLLHGEKDPKLPPSCSEALYNMAPKPKRLHIFPGNRHDMKESSEELHQVVYDWLREELA